MPTTDGTWRVSASRDAMRRWAGPQLLLASVFLLLAVALFLVVRRAIGALASPLPPLPLTTTALDTADITVQISYAPGTDAGRSAVAYYPGQDKYLVVWEQEDAASNGFTDEIFGRLIDTLF